MGAGSGVREAALPAQPCPAQAHNLSNLSSDTPDEQHSVHGGFVGVKMLPGLAHSCTLHRFPAGASQGLCGRSPPPPVALHLLQPCQCSSHCRDQLLHPQKLLCERQCSVQILAVSLGNDASCFHIRGLGFCF